ncbi:hypothetical protein [Candidatus Pantoea floridensis]|uniref:Uncharacterized protein n=1 Tax=Candidatus Pantoea floridensis TaxID=1938870 RepID=A0A286BXD2_9GAMM|nr:hypothetical protein [Pantoea floridensis]PIF21294.1 hypothetical protein BX596_0686 [Enterobacteriaceae bacterium JKS000233]SOD38806.1 hypothetical protein SAMN06273570_3239 [Pantoea floridensis]
MNKNWSLGASQQRHNRQQRLRAEKRRENAEGIYLPSQNVINFSYKGIILRKSGNEYTIDKQIMISGCDTSKVQGMWNDGPMLARAIDYMLETAKPERLAEVRAAHINWTCQRCKVTCLYDKSFEDHRDENHPLSHCKYCGFNTPRDELVTASDEVMR